MTNKISITYKKNSDLHDCEIQLTPIGQQSMMEHLRTVFNVELITGSICIRAGIAYISFQSTEAKLKALQRIVMQAMFLENRSKN